jgi:AraC-like DNA-binding protein
MRSIRPAEAASEPDNYPILVRRDLLSSITSDLDHHSYLEMQFIIHGRVTYFVQDTGYLATNRSVVFIGPNIIHNLIVEPGHSIHKIRLQCPPDIFKGNRLVSSTIAKLREAVHLSLARSEASRSGVLLEEMIQEIAHRGENYREVVQRYLETLILILGRSLDTSNPVVTEDSLSIREIIRYLDASFADNITLNSTANRFCLSPNYMSALFKRNVGAGFKEYLINRRIVEAKKLLESTSLKITVIAFRVGFDSISTFYRDFHMAVGLTPSEFRQLSRNVELDPSA